MYTWTWREQMKLGGITGGIPWPADGLAGPVKPLSWYIKPLQRQDFQQESPWKILWTRNCWPDFFRRRIKSKKHLWYFFPRVFIDIFTAAPTVDGRTPKQPPGMVLKPCKYWEKLPTYLLAWSTVEALLTLFDNLLPLEPRNSVGRFRWGQRWGVESRKKNTMETQKSKKNNCW